VEFLTISDVQHRTDHWSVEHVFVTRFGAMRGLGGYGDSLLDCHRNRQF
jgi:hypothetical protein